MANLAPDDEDDEVDFVGLTSSGWMYVLSPWRKREGRGRKRRIRVSEIVSADCRIRFLYVRIKWCIVVLGVLGFGICWILMGV